MSEKLFLRNYDTVYGFLRTFATEFFDCTENPPDDEAKRAQRLCELCERSAAIFLGGTDDYHLDTLWNEPGYIDEHLATIMPFPSTDPHERMRTFFLVFATKLSELAAFANTPGVKDEQWQESGTLMYQEFAMMLLGIPTKFKSAKSDDR
jgi:hypothetical protein